MPLRSQWYTGYIRPNPARYIAVDTSTLAHIPVKARLAGRNSTYQAKRVRLIPEDTSELTTYRDTDRISPIFQSRHASQVAIAHIRPELRFM